MMMKAQWLLYVPPYLALKNSAFCPHSVFMCFIWISELTAIISLYSINWMVFIREMESVYCVVRAESVYAFQGILAQHGRAVYQVVSGRPITAEAWVRSQLRFVVEKVAQRQVFLRILWFFPCHCRSTNGPYSSSPRRCSY